jgi:phage head maturation protease
LYDVSVVTFPAYEQTVAEVRGMLLRDAEEPATISPVTTFVRLRQAQLALARQR